MKKAWIFLAAAMSIMLSACSQTKDLENTPAPVIGEFSETENDDKTLTEDHDEDGGSITDESKTDLYEDEYHDYDADEPPLEIKRTPEIYEGEYTGNTISDPAYDSLEIQKNEDGTYAIQVKIPFLTQLYECAGCQSENGILFSTVEWGTDKKVEGSISFDEDSATVTFTSGWYQTATTENSYQYHKTSDTPDLESGPDARPDYSSFTGEYCDTNNDPSLEIRQNEDGSYLIQISLFREIGYDGCIGSLDEGKMFFTSDERGGVSGSVTLDNDLAVIRFEQIGYFENAKVTTYLFQKTSDNPNIYEAD